MLLGVVLLELLEVGTGNESGLLARADHHRLGLADLDALDEGVQFVQYRLRQRVDRRVGAVEGEHEHAVGALLGGPVAKTQSVEHGFLLMRARGPAAKWL